MKGGSFMANTEIFLRNIFGTTRPNIRPLVLALNITNDLLFEQHISMSDIKATKHIYPDVARLLHKKPETVYKSVIRLAHRCWDALVEQDLVLSYSFLSGTLYEAGTRSQRFYYLSSCLHSIRYPVF